MEIDTWVFIKFDLCDHLISYYLFVWDLRIRKDYDFGFIIVQLELVGKKAIQRDNRHLKPILEQDIKAVSSTYDHTCVEPSLGL